MDRTAKIFLNNRGQAVRVPKDFQVKSSEVFIRHQGEDVVLSARPSDWGGYLTQGPVAPADFMSSVEDLPVQVRTF
jgi:antitoxin VapB